MNLQTSASPSLCPCGSGAQLSSCCLPLIQGKESAPTAEALLRSRYTAFTRGDVDYILGTHHSRTRGEIKRDEIEDWSRNSKWLGLEIVQQDPGETADQATIIFCARYETEGKPQEHWERSLFEKEAGEWRFVDAQGLQQGPYRRAEPKVGRNDPCPCGSGKKFKKCCSA
ncbi:MAG: YchJ family metal-binding protein [Oligoflexia bacterium]|nr:YchJ family metal-binding protein [Oligoflexia bacterium]